MSARGVDLSSVQLTHHSLKNQGLRDLAFATDEAPKLTGGAEVGSGGIYEKALLDAIIERVNDLFEGDLTDDDQFANSPTLRQELMDAAMDSDAAFNVMSRQVLNSEAVREELLKILLGPGRLYEMLRGEAER